MSTLLEVRGLVVQADTGTQLVRGVDLRLERGKVLALVGESGSGKSLTCLSIMGLLPRGMTMAEGEIHLEGRRIDGLPPESMRRLRGPGLAMILQHPMSCFNPVVSIRTHMRETLAAHNAPAEAARDERLAQALAEVALPDPRSLLDAFPFQLSGGMLQRAMMATALLMGASCLLADEPTTDLDVGSQARILDLLDELRVRRGLGILLVTHDLSVAARLADTVAVMRHGRIVEQDTAARIYAGPRDPYARRLLGAHLALYGMTLADLPRAGQEVPS